MMLATFSDYIGFSILWAIPFLNASKTCLMLRSVSQTLTGRVLDTTDKRDRRLEERVKNESGIHNPEMQIFEVWNPYYVHVVGTNLFKKQTKMFVTPGLDLVDNEVFFWLYKHESYYAINRSFLKAQTIKALSVTISAIVFSIILEYSFAVSVFYTILVGMGVDLICFHSVESRADAFAIENASVEELKGAKRFLKVAREENKKKTYFQRVINSLMHSSYYFRMKRVDKALAKQGVTYILEEEKLEPLRLLLQKNNLEETSFIEAKKQQVLRWIDADED